ncbi:MAG: hypothetical protein WD342_20690 [Verrucomicrobiales bacterium]
MDKTAIVEDLKRQLQEQYRRAVEALAGARDAATGDDSKAEGKYDTRGLEASYLASGQAEQVEHLARSIATLEDFGFKDYDIDDSVGPGALVEAEAGGEVHFYLLAPVGGGLTCETEDGETVTILGPASPLREMLLGKTSGTVLEDPPVTILEVT